MFGLFKKKVEKITSCKNCVYYSEAKHPDKLLPDKTIKKGETVAITCSKMNNKLNDLSPCDYYRYGENSTNPHAILYYIKNEK